jgi:hypothetical protein
VRTSSEVPEAGQVLETTTRKRVLSADAAADKKTTPDFWEYLERLKPSDWERHILYIYRRDSETGPMPQLEKCIGNIVMPDGSRVDLTSREETEFAIVQKYGGGTYRLILKRGHERVTETRIHGEGARRNPPPIAGYDAGAPMISNMSEASATAEVAHHAITSIAQQEKTGFEVAGAALRTSAEVVQRFANQVATAPPASEADQMMKQLMLRMLERLVAPPPDPIELLGKLLTVTAQLSGGGGGVGGPLVSKILDTAVEKLLNPAPSGPVASTSAELVRQLPQVASYVSQAIAEWRAGTEAQRDTAAIMRGVNPAARSAATPGATASPTLLQPGKALPPPGAPPEVPMGAPSLEFIESRILQILREPIPADEAADKTFEFLDTIDPQLVEHLKSLGEQGLLMLFHSRAMLNPATQNVPRLQEFIRAFLKFASEGDGPGAEAPKPN